MKPRETRCAHDMVIWPDLGLSSCADCRGLPPGATHVAPLPLTLSLDSITEVPMGRLHLLDLEPLERAA